MSDISNTEIVDEKIVVDFEQALADDAKAAILLSIRKSIVKR